MRPEYEALSQDYHTRAMAMCDDAIKFKREGHSEMAQKHFVLAFEYEQIAAGFLRDRKDFEPTRSILYRSAATIAHNAGMHKESMDMVLQGLLGNPPEDIKRELMAVAFQSWRMINRTPPNPSP